MQSAPVRYGRRAYDSDGAEATADLSASFGEMDDAEAVRRPHRLDALDETLDLSSSFGQARATHPASRRACTHLEPTTREQTILPLPTA